MSRQIIALNDTGWHFGQAPRQPFAATNVYDLSAVREWLPATVPGNVRADLLAQGRLADPFVGAGYRESLWVEAVDWWYTYQLQAPPLASNRRAFLIFEGIDYLSAIFVNGLEVARHEGMFSRQIVELTAALQEGQAQIAVRLWGSDALPQRRLSLAQRLWKRLVGPIQGGWVGVYPDRSATFKCQMSFGWDFAPPIRTMGIWDEVTLVMSGPVFIREANVLAEANVMAQPLLEGHAADAPISHAPTDLALKLTLDAQTPSRVQIELQINPANFTAPAREPFHFELDLPVGQSSHQLKIHLPEVALWQPWDRGYPHLYDLRITLKDQDGLGLDQLMLQTGIRAIELKRWQFKVNGHPEFMRGLNWVPADSFPGRLQPETYERLLTQARQSGANLLRVWGGGLREKRAFYDECDRLGLLVWQEFPFACMFLGAYPREAAYLAAVEAECGAIVKQISHHPSLIVWGGGNEFSPRRNRPLLNSLARVVAQHDGTRPFLPVSPSHDDAHNWQVWHGEAPIRAYQAETARFLSEFGLQALPQLASLEAMLSDLTTDWDVHHADSAKLLRYASIFTRQSGQNVKIPHSAFLIPHSQKAQAIALQTAIEYMRRRKGEAGGVCLWQFNEPWPAISWAIVDYYGRPKLAYERLLDWYRPILISLNFPLGRRWPPGETFIAEIWAINDSLETLAGCTLHVKIDDDLIHSQTLDLPTNTAQYAGQFTHEMTSSPRQISLILTHQTKLIAKNEYDLTWQDLPPGSFYQRFRRWVAGWALY